MIHIIIVCVNYLISADVFIFVISCKQSVNSRVVIYLFTIIHRLRRFQPCLFPAPEIFTPDVYGTKNRRRKMELI